MTAFKPPTINLRSTDPSKDEIRSLPELLEFNARNNPNHIFCIQAEKSRSNDETDGLDFQRISHLQFSDAVRACSQWLQEHVPELKTPQRNEQNEVIKGPPIALLMESDVGILIHIMALMSLGVPLLLLSARLNTDAILHLLNETQAAALIASPQLMNTAKEVGKIQDDSSKAVAIYRQVNYKEFLDNSASQNSSPVHTEDHYVGEADRNVFILHSSGTTGYPKAIYVSHRYFLGYATCSTFKNESQSLGLNITTLPLYHGFGLVSPILSFAVGKTFCIFPPSRVPTGSSTARLIELTKAQSLMSVPSILEEICQLPEDQGIDVLKTLDFVLCGGGALKEAVGDKFADAGVRILNAFGTTETGPLTLIFVPDAPYNWQYFRFRSDLDIKMVPVSEDATPPTYHLTVQPFGWDDVFEVQDAMVPDPNHPSTDFKAVGRSDALIVLATGEKVLPSNLESAVCECKDVKGALAFGDRQLQIGIIVEPTPAALSEDPEHCKSRIWSHIENINSRLDHHARIVSQDLIILADTPLPRSDKGAIRRTEALKLFEQQISDVVNNLDESALEIPTQPLDLENAEQSLKDLIQSKLNWKLSPEEWGIYQDFFELGMDSLKAMHLRRLILANSTRIPWLKSLVTRNFIYEHPSVNKIAVALRRRSDGSSEVLDMPTRVEQLVQKYSLWAAPIVVLLTGCTGSLGSHLVAHLAQLPEVSEVICLDRPGPKSPKDRLKEALEAKEVVLPHSSWSKIRALHGHLAEPFLGLGENEYSYLLGNVTHVVHSAWPMDFKRTLISFEPQFVALKNLLQIARDARPNGGSSKTRFLFVSSISAVGEYSTVHGDRIVPELPVGIESCAGGLGYGHAKLVCEKIVQQSQIFNSDIEAVSLRFGQISGCSKTGYWNEKEHFPALLKSSQKIGALPIIGGTFSWIPVDHAANVIADIMLSKSPINGIYHVENPVRQSWQDTLAILAAHVTAKPLELVPYTQWLERLSKVPINEVDSCPALKISEFFEEHFNRMSGGSVILDTSRSRDVSPTLKAADVLESDIIGRYVDYWRRSGFLG
ncbi:uncharacterized protein K452DRAFT_281299 [Aplosporella prunicola CBS 121167]|uniref:Carrier domain-containing protein n=1 Tax=Aplosporella prunicola CBS 121167 TaxID=1176127 RepID=A0A6A6AUB8_9PEZI|nr:uncharacterized protein K452DRAFT_281299 [Aplosporella prunicola CBS 121167]KAF2135592.1 hypothetical protein K452DRAFT_281299 [Aplosporella prunicola CBS 121167]